MSPDARDTIAFKVVQVTETTSSVAMEKEAFKHCIEDLLKADMNIQVIVTDCHTGIVALCRREYPHIDHQFDIWHVTKVL